MRISQAQFRARLLLLPRQTHPLARAAAFALTANGYPMLAGWCEKWARLVKERAYGGAFSHLRRGTATEAFYAFKNAGYAVDVADGSVEGDLLYKLRAAGGKGHVGTRLKGNWVAENSTVHGGDADARGLRTIEEFGTVEGIIRLPAKTTGEN
jgi:hypothetical protein